MQKKLIALAVAGLLSAPAFAQSNVTLYGTIDYGFSSLGDNMVEDAKSRSGIDSGISKQNRIGFKGVEDLGNGLKAVFVLETGLNGDQGSMFNDMNRQSYAGLAGGFGTVAFGRHYTPQHLFTSAVDPFAKNGLGSAGNVLVQERRLNNLAAYISPTWSGFNFIAAYSFNGTAAAGFGGGNEAFQNNGDIQAWAIAPSFTWGKLFVAANYHQASVNLNNGLVSNGSDDVDALQVYDLYASYDFGIVKLGATFGQRITDQEALRAVTGNPLIDEDSKLTQWMIGATFKITPNDSILASYTQATENDWNDDDNKGKLRQFAIGYEHALSKRTTLYAQAAWAKTNDDFEVASGFQGVLVTDGTYGGPASTYLGADGMDYRRGFAVGFRHDF
ncbi:MAG: porin [Azoarcus sp.]|jgi:predicted porin|nr:porin [Azoarcus sp.]